MPFTVLLCVNRDIIIIIIIIAHTEPIFKKLHMVKIIDRLSIAV